MNIVAAKMDMERIRQLAREQGVDLAVQRLFCLPQEIKKFTGSFAKRQKKGGVVAYDVHIQYKDFSCSKRLNTEAEAEQYIQDTNVREGLPIRKLFTIFEDQLEVEIVGGKTLICNVDNLYFVELHNWYCTSGYAATNTSGITTKQYFHNVSMFMPSVGPPSL